MIVHLYFLPSFQNYSYNVGVTMLTKFQKSIIKVQSFENLSRLGINKNIKPVKII